MKRICRHLFFIASAFAVAACSFFGANSAPQSFTLRDEGSFKIEEKSPFPIVAATAVDGRNVPFATNRRKIIVVYGGQAMKKKLIEYW